MDLTDPTVPKKGEFMGRSQLLAFHPTGPDLAKPWKKERLYFRGDDYFRDLLKSIARAKNSVDLETYIFEPGWIGNRIVEALVRAAQRKVKVRVLVDGVGSPQFATAYGPRLSKAGIPYRVYRSWPTFFSTVYHRFRILHFFKSIQDSIALFDSGKHRDHRKQVIVDNKTVWIGSFNVSDWHLEKQKGKEVWRDTGLRLTGVKSLVFRLAFHSAWEDPWPHHFKRLYRHALLRWLSHSLESGPVRMTASRKLRRSFRRELLERINAASRRVWILTPYFVPTGPLYRALIRAAKRGLDVRIIVPAHSDVPVVRLTSRVYYQGLLRAGCRLFEYQKSILHAKTTMIDQWVLVGSSNLDYRSLRKDLEINVLPRDRRSVGLLERQFRRDQVESREVRQEDVRTYPIWQRILSWFFFRFRNWF